VPTLDFHILETLDKRVRARKLSEALGLIIIIIIIIRKI
jgi:hypothetical protein